MVPTEEFRRHQLAVLERASTPRPGVRDPERAQRNRVERDRLVAADAVGSAIALGIRVIEIDGSVPAEAVADTVADHFGLPPDCPYHPTAPPMSRAIMGRWSSIDLRWQPYRLDRGGGSGAADVGTVAPNTRRLDPRIGLAGLAHAPRLGRHTPSQPTPPVDR